MVACDDDDDDDLTFQEVEKVTKQMHLEAHLADAKLAKAKMEMAAEKEILLQEKQQLLMVRCCYKFSEFLFFYNLSVPGSVS